MYNILYMRTWGISLVLLIALIAIANIYSIGKDVSKEIGTFPDGRMVSVETYVQQNISELSPLKEVLGGKYYVTEIHASNGRGIVHYEDGHVAHAADFTYTIHSDVGITIDSFVVRF